MPEDSNDILQTWKTLGEEIDTLKSKTDELKKERRAAVVTLIERKKNALTKEKSVHEERPGSPRAVDVYKLPEPWDNYYYSDGMFYTRALVGNLGSGDRPLLRQIGEGETDVLIGGSNLIEALVALPNGV